MTGGCKVHASVSATAFRNWQFKAGTPCLSRQFGSLASWQSLSRPGVGESGCSWLSPFASHSGKQGMRCRWLLNFEESHSVYERHFVSLRRRSLSSSFLKLVSRTSTERSLHLLVGRQFVHFMSPIGSSTSNSRTACVRCCLAQLSRRNRRLVENSSPPCDRTPFRNGHGQRNSCWRVA